MNQLPKKIVVLEIIDGGPMESSNTRCPHCGAEGRWIYRFLCDDGQIWGAMAGCIKLFPQARKTPLSIMAEKAVQKQRDIRDCFSKNQLASWFNNVLTALRALELKEITLEQAEIIGQTEYTRRAEWLQKNGFTRKRR